MPVTRTTTDEFTSLDELRDAQGQLLNSLPAEGLMDEASRERTRDFLRQASRLGAWLDAPEDRKFAQGVLDYWAATLYSEARDRAPQQERLPLEETALAAFNEAEVQLIIDRAEQALRSLGLDGDEVPRRLLLRLARLCEQGATFTPVAAPRAELLAGPDMGQAEPVLQALEKAGAVVVDADGKARLRAPALMRRWARLSTWLKKRALFRAAARFWQEHEKAQAALFTGTLLDEAGQYGDFNDLEREFVSECRNEAQRQGAETLRRLRFYQALFAAVGVLLVAVVVAGFWAIRESWRVQQLLADQATQAEETARASEARNQAEASAALAFALLLLDGDEAGRRVGKMVLIAQTLARLVFAPQDKVEDAESSWERLELVLREEEWFTTHFLDDPRYEKLLDIIQEKGKEPARRRSALRESANLLREEIIKTRDPNYLRALHRMRRYWFNQAVNVAEQLASGAAGDRTREHLRAYREHFWRLYCCELALVGGPKVTRAMDAVARALQKWKKNANGPAPDDVRKELHEAAERLAAACGSEDNVPLYKAF